MKKGINYWAFAQQGASESRAPLEPAEALRRAKELGYDCFEPTIEASGTLSPATTKKQAQELRAEAERIGIEITTVASGLAWGESPTDADPAVRARAIETYRRAIEIASWLGAKTLLYLPGMVSAVFVPSYAPQPYEAVWKRASDAVKALLPDAERHGVRLGVENVWNRFLLSPTEMRSFIDSFGSKQVGSYFDVGNVMLYGHPDDWIRTLGHRIIAVHLKDFKVSVGNLDGFVDLLSGDVDYRSVMAAFRSIGYAGSYTAEIVPGAPGAVEKAIAALKIIETF